MSSIKDSLSEVTLTKLVTVIGAVIGGTSEPVGAGVRTFVCYTFENSTSDAFDKLAQITSIMWRTHPWTVLRAAQFQRWIDDGGYGKILRRGTSRNADQSRCDNNTPNPMLSLWIQPQLRQFGTDETRCPRCGHTRSCR